VGCDFYGAREHNGLLYIAHEREIAASFAKTIAGACNKKEQGHLK
jgi:hypothetical protein